MTSSLHVGALLPVRLFLRERARSCKVEFKVRPFPSQEGQRGGGETEVERRRVRDESPLNENGKKKKAQKQ